MFKARSKYATDPTYHKMVDFMVDVIEGLQLTPSEMREAAMLASIMFEERKPTVTWTFTGEEQEDR